MKRAAYMAAILTCCYFKLRMLFDLLSGTASVPEGASFPRPQVPNDSEPALTYFGKPALQAVRMLSSPVRPVNLMGP